MKPSDLLQLIPNVDFGVPREDILGLPELPEFTEALRRQMQREVRLYSKPVLSIDNLAWGGLYLILAAHEQRTADAEVLDEFAPTLLPHDGKAAVEGVRNVLLRAEKELRLALQQNGVRHLLEGHSGSVADHIQKAVAIVDTALEADTSKRSQSHLWADDDRSGLLEYLLARWWQRTTGKPASLSKSGKKNGDPSAYVSFLRLCFTVLSRPPADEATADVLIARRKRYAVQEEAFTDALRTIETRLSPMRDMSFFSSAVRRSKS